YPAASSHIYPLSLHDALPISSPHGLTYSLSTPSTTSCSAVEVIRISLTSRAWTYPGLAPLVFPVTNTIRPDTFRWACGSTSRKRSEEHTSELQSRFDIVCRLL